MQTPRGTTRQLGWWEPLALAVCFGSIAGAVHVATVAYRQHVNHAFTWTSRDITWMSPLGNMVILLVPAAVLAIIALVRRQWAGRGWMAGVLGVVAAVSALLNVRGLHPIALAVLALGIGVQVGRLAGLKPDGWRRWTVRVAIVGVAMTVLMFVITSRARGSAPASTATADAPNVLVLILDTVRASSTSLHGYARPTTPALEQMAREGVWYEWAVSPSSWTLPSHAAMFTGRRASQLSASWRRPLDDAHPTVAEALAGAGYATGAFVGNLYYTHHESGIDRGFQVLRDFRRSKVQVLWSTTLGQTPLVMRLLWGPRSASAWMGAVRDFELTARSEPQQDRRHGAEVIDDFLDWQEGVRGPFFAFVNLYDAHDPYEPLPPYRTIFTNDPGKQDLYDGGIRYMDDQLERLFGTLKQRGLYDRTLVVVSSDHGEQWGEHELTNHGNSLYLPAVHVPLVMRYPPRIAAGSRVPEPVTLTSLAATILDVTGVRASDIPGTSLLGKTRDVVITETEALDPTARANSPAQHGPLASIVSDSLQYIRNGDSTYQLFDIRRDPGQLVNLATSTERCAPAVTLDAQLRALSALPRTPPFDRTRCPAAPDSGR